MNVTKIIIGSLLIGLLLGILVTGLTGYYILYRPTMDGLRAELSASRADAAIYRDRAERSEEAVRNVRGIITTSTTTITGTITTIQQAREQIRGIIETLRKIREMVEVKELDNGG